MSGIKAAFATAHRERRAAFIPFLMAGDPDPARTPGLCQALARAGADIIELGVPFSDPLADGPTIQRAALRALAAGGGLGRSLELAARVRQGAGVPVVLFTYYNPILRMGEKLFAERAAGAGVDGVLVTDLPPEESSTLDRLLHDAGIDPIRLLAPTSTPARMQAAARGRGFVYYISRTGVTGQRESLPPNLEAELARVRSVIPLPVAVGFGISTAAQAAEAARMADGVVVGSALVTVVERGLDARGVPGNDPEATLEREARRLRDAMVIQA